MKTTQYNFFDLLDEFITKCKTGRHLLKNGARMRPESIKNYESMRKVISLFCEKTKFELRIIDLNKSGKNEILKEKNYWKRFYFKFTEYMYKERNCFDNYTGATIKLIRCFFNYIIREKGIHTGNFHKNFYVRHEEIPIIVLSPEQLNFLIYNKDFEESLSFRLKKVKDIFVFGCTVGLRYSDIKALTPYNIEVLNSDYYLSVVSKKTSTATRIRLPEYAVKIIKNQNKHSKTIFPKLHLSNFNKYLQEIGQLAGWTHNAEKQRQKRGILKQTRKSLQTENHQVRFCDLLTSHSMRKTAITMMVCLGMPEPIVRNISGHSPGSKDFHRYVNYSQAYLDQETSKVFEKLSEKRLIDSHNLLVSANQN